MDRHSTFVLALLALLLALASPPAKAAETPFETAGEAPEPVRLEPVRLEPVRLEPLARHLESERHDWFGIYAGHDKLGFLRASFEPSADGTAYRVETETHLKVVTLGENREMRSIETLRFAGAEPWPLLSGLAVTEQGPYRQEIRLERRGEGYEAEIVAGGSSRLLPVPELDYTLADLLTPEIWLGRPRREGDRLSARAFTLTDLESGFDTYTVGAIRDTLVDGVPVRYYEVDLVSSVTGPIGSALFEADGRLVSGTIAGAFELRRETEALATDFEHTADVYLLGMAPVDAPLGDPAAIRRLVLAVEEGDPTAIPSFDRQSVERDPESGRWILRLGEGQGEPQTADPDEIAEALDESVEHPIHDEVIRALAEEAVEGAASPREKVEALVEFVDRFLEDSYSAEPLTVLDMLTTRKGDCTEHALLFTTLARSVGLPTREVSGLLYMGDDAQAFGGHAWNEVVVDGRWLPVDPTWGEFEINPGHIRLGPRTGTDASAEALFGRYQFELVEIERLAGADQPAVP